jgi:hypothetical protein
MLRCVLTAMALACGAARAAEPAAPPPQEVPAVNPVEGTWVYAKDPAKKVKSEKIYEGSTITFGPAGAYSFRLAETTIALKGTWEVRGADGDVVRVHTEYGQGRRNDLTLTLRRDPHGTVVGMEVREGDGSTGARYYVPQGH